VFDRCDARFGISSVGVAATAGNLERVSAMLNLSAVIAWHVSAMTAERVFEHDPNALPSGYLKLPGAELP